MTSKVALITSALALALLATPSPAAAQVPSDVGSSSESGPSGDKPRKPRDDGGTPSGGLIPDSRPGASSPGSGGAAAPIPGSGSSSAPVKTLAPLPPMALPPAPEPPAPWLLWWERNRSAFIDSRAALETAGVRTGSETVDRRLRATSTQVDSLRGALLDAAASDSLERVVEAVLTIGELDPLWEAGDRTAFRELLWRATGSRSRPVAEAAYTALAVGAREDEVMRLASSALDEEADRSLRRAALVGLWRVAERTDREDVRRLCAHYLMRCGEAFDRRETELRGAALWALASVPLSTVGVRDPGGIPEPVGTSRLSVLRHLLEELERVRRKEPDLLPHACEALALAVSGLPDATRRIIAPSAADALLELHERRRRLSREALDALVRALGSLPPLEDQRRDRKLTDALWSATDEADLRTRTAAWMALSHRASDSTALDDPTQLELRRELGRRLTRGSSSDRPALALALGVGAWRLRDAGREAPAIWTVALRSALGSAGGPEERTAIALALGLAGDVESESALLDGLDQLPVGPERARYGIALGLRGSPSVLGPLRAELDRFEFDGAISARFAECLGLAGDLGLRSRLVERARGERSRDQRLAALVGLARVGGPLQANAALAIATDENEPSAVRGAALHAAGRMLLDDPWEWTERAVWWSWPADAPCWPGEEFSWGPVGRR